MTTGGRLEHYRRGDLRFDFIDIGPADGTPVVFLHGFPQFNTSWAPVMERLAAQGYRCLAPNQRGYSPGARPPHRRDYVVDELVADVVALIDAIGAPKVHLVGHDWGATVAWATAAVAPDRLATLTTLSVPHPAAFFKALATSKQMLASWYMYFFQLPVIPEWFYSRADGKHMARFLRDYAGQSPEDARRDVARILESDALRTTLNWYRAIPLASPRRLTTRTTVPTLHVWSDGDKALLEQAARETGRYVEAEYRFEILRDVSHWILDECPDTVAGLLNGWLPAHPVAAS